MRKAALLILLAFFVFVGSAFGGLLVEVQVTQPAAAAGSAPTTKPANQQGQSAKSSAQTLMGSDGQFLASLSADNRTIRLEGSARPDTVPGRYFVRISFSDMTTLPSGINSVTQASTNANVKLDEPVRISSLTDREGREIRTIFLTVREQTKP